MGQEGSSPKSSWIFLDPVDSPQQQPVFLNGSQLIEARLGGDQVAYFSNSSFILLLLKQLEEKDDKSFKHELLKIMDHARIENPKELQIFHMDFSKESGRCVFFYRNDDTGVVTCAVCESSTLKPERRNSCTLDIDLHSLRGGYSNAFQIFDCRYAKKLSPFLLFTCQNEDNSIKVYDLLTKEKSKLKHEERSHTVGMVI